MQNTRQNSIPRSYETAGSSKPPLPQRANAASRNDHDGTAMNWVPQGHDIIQEGSRKSAEQQSAPSAPAAVARSQEGPGIPANINASQPPQDIPRQSQPKFPKTLRGDSADTGRTGWNPLSYIMPRSAPSDVITNSNSSAITSAQIAKEKQRYTHSETAERFLKYKQRTHEAEARAMHLENEIANFQGMNESLQLKVQGQDFAVRKAQESAFAVVASTGPKAEDDDIIRSKLKSVTSQWKPFAKKWALRSLQELQGEKFELAKPILEELVADDEYDSHDGLFQHKNDNKAPGILLNAELARFVVNQLLEKPFTAAFGFNSSQETISSNGRTSQTLHELYLYLRHDDPETAHSWRSQTVSSIDPPQHHVRPMNTARKDEAKKRKENYYRGLITQFETSPARAFYRECSQDEILERRTELLEIFRASGDLFSGLWAQKVEIGSLGRRKLLKKAFEVQSREFEAHASHRLEEGDRELNGKPIQLVVEPAIVAWGNEYGEGYDQYKVWAKAVVWVSTPTSNQAGGGGGRDRQRPPR